MGVETSRTGALEKQAQTARTRLEIGFSQRWEFEQQEQTRPNGLETVIKSSGSEPLARD